MIVRSVRERVGRSPSDSVPRSVLRETASENAEGAARNPMSCRGVEEVCAFTMYLTAPPDQDHPPRHETACFDGRPQIFGERREEAWTWLADWPPVPGAVRLSDDRVQPQVAWDSLQLVRALIPELDPPIRPRDPSRSETRKSRRGPPSTRLLRRRGRRSPGACPRRRHTRRCASQSEGSRRSPLPIEDASGAFNGGGGGVEPHQKPVSGGIDLTSSVHPNG